MTGFLISGKKQEQISSDLGQEKVVLNLFENGFSTGKRVETSDFLPGWVELDFDYKSLAFICYGAERKEGIKSESTVMAQVFWEMGEISLGDTSSLKEEAELGVSFGMKGWTRCGVKCWKIVSVTREMQKRRSKYRQGEGRFTFSSLGRMEEVFW